MRVIGTAGHVDHGKSTLVRRLTGIDPDRLAEEKKREMTIDLGFAWLQLPNNETVGIVDVPGHRDFIENMLSGIGGIDAAVLVVAADEGVMPQTREHLAILDLLGVENGLIALTKIDMVEDEDWLDLVEQEVMDVVQGTSLQDAPITRLSAHTGAGIPEFIDSLTERLDALPPRSNYNHPRLPIDRVFTISGFGTVVTGTLSGGTLEVGDDVELQPSGKKGRVRGLQSYKQAVQIALPGSRVAVNIAGVDKDDVERGQVLTYPGQLRPTILVDVHFRHLADAGRPLKHNAEVKFFSGAAESVANVRLLNDETLAPGTEGWLQLRLQNPVPLTRSDRFIIRYPSPPQTIGGGIVVNPHPGRRWRRFRQEVIRDLQTRMKGTPAERIAQAAQGTMPFKAVHLQKETGYSDSELEAAIGEALQESLLVEMPDGTYMASDSYHNLQEQLLKQVILFHNEEPLRSGMPREQLRSQLNIKGVTLNMLLEMQHLILIENNLLRMPDHAVRFTEKQQADVDRFWLQIEAAPFTPPSYTEAVEMIGEKVLRALIDLGYIVQVQPEVILSHEVYETMVSGILQMIDDNGAVSTGEVRDQFNTSRKYVIGLLEHLDSQGITRREGDERVRGRNTRK